MNMREIEVRFLEIDKQSLVDCLVASGAEDRGEQLLTETIIYDRDLEWKEKNTFLKLRKTNTDTLLTYKEQTDTIDGTLEIEFVVSDAEMAQALLAKLGYPGFRQQEKYRHTLVLDGVTFDIDTWPHIPTYVELEGSSEAALKQAAEKVGLAWIEAVVDNPRKIIEERYGIPVGSLRWFTFDRVE